MIAILFGRLLFSVDIPIVIPILLLALGLMKRLEGVFIPREPVILLLRYAEFIL